MAAVEALLVEIETLMDVGAGRSELLRAFPEIPPRTLDDYIRRADDRALEENAAKREMRRARGLRRQYNRMRELMTERAAAGPDPQKPPGSPARDPKRLAEIDRAIDRIEDRIAKMEGTFAPEVIKIVRSGGFESMTPEQLRHVGKTGRLPAGFTSEDVARHN